MQKAIFFLFILSTALCNDNLSLLEKKSFLYQSKKIIQESTPVSTTYEKADPQGVIDTASVWLDFTQDFVEKELDLFKMIGMQAFNLSSMPIRTQKNTTFIKDLDLYDGLEADFTLATKNYQDYSRLYLLTEIKEKDWKYLPLKAPFKLDNVQLLSLKKSYPLLSNHGSTYLATPPVKGVDHSVRRWIYPFYEKNKIALLNFFDPSFLANSLASGKVLQARKRGKILQLPPNNEGISLFETELLSMMIRKYGGFSYQKLDLPLEEYCSYTTSGPDLFSPPFFKTAFIHCFIHKNTELLKDLYRQILSNKIPLKQFIHSQENTSPIIYSGNYLKNLQLQSLLIEDLNYFFEKEASFLKVDNKEVSISNIGLCACTLGINTISKDQKNLLEAHLLMTFFHAMQPGVLALSTEDLRGTYYDYNKKKPCALYASVKSQLENPQSYCSQLQKILRIRNLYHIDQGTLSAIIPTKNKQIFCYLLNTSSEEKIVMILNFGDKTVGEDISSDFFLDTYAIDLFEEKSYPKLYRQKNLTINLQRHEAKCLALKRKNSDL